MKYIWMIVIVLVALIVHTYFSITCDVRTPFQQLDVVSISVITGVISGFVANGIFRLFETNEKHRTIKKKLSEYEGTYDVYHWRDLTTPDGCGYQVNMTLDNLNGILKIHQTGSEAVHELHGDIKINELTFNYGEGNYTHPQKTGNPTGRIQIYLIGNGVVNVDKYYLDDQTHQPRFEKWQWRKKN